MFRHSDAVLGRRGGGSLLEQRIQVQHTVLGTDRPRWRVQNIKILKYINLTSIKLKSVLLTLRYSRPLQVQ